MNLALEDRDGLPDALRVLLAEHPRESWESDPNFNGLISFWLDRHMMFRKLGTVMQTEARTLLDGKSDADHHALDGHLNRFVEVANGAIKGWTLIPKLLRLGF